MLLPLFRYWTILLVVTCNCLAQTKFPAPVNTTDLYNACAALLPDSSIISYSTIGKSMGVVARYVFNSKEWAPAPDHLTALLNSLLPDNDSHMHFRFSTRGDRLFVILHKNQNKSQQYFESTLVNGEWTHFRQILKDADHAYINAPFSYSLDNQKLYVWTRKEPANQFYIYHLVNGDWTNPVAVKDFYSRFDEIFYVIGLTHDAVLIRAIPKGSKKNEHFLSKQLPNGEWSAPLRVKEFPNEANALALTPGLDQFTYTHFGEGNLYIMDAPQLIRNEITRARLVQPVAIQSQVIKEETPLSETAASGKYYALVIGNADYQLDKLDLTNPVKDVQTLKQTLAQYQFDEENVITLINSNRNQILQELYRLRNRVTPKDNLLIFYAGHGYWDEKINQGYWWPIDAVPDNPSNWLSNSDLREQIRGINSKHTLLISDACFSGGIFKTRGAEEIRSASLDIQLLYRMPSRRAMTSGTLSSVPDNSVFFKYLVKYLEENERKFIASGDLFTAIRTSILNNSLTVPQDGVIMDTGDEGGDFIFIKRD